MDGNLRIPYGVINWAELVRECHFVDNTACIRELEACKTPVFLRPKRFLARRPDWNHPIEATVVEVCGSAGYNWFDLDGD